MSEEEQESPEDEWNRIEGQRERDLAEGQMELSLEEIREIAAHRWKRGLPEKFPPVLSETGRAVLQGYDGGECPRCGKRTIVSSGSMSACDSCDWRNFLKEEQPVTKKKEEGEDSRKTISRKNFFLLCQQLQIERETLTSERPSYSSVAERLGKKFGCNISEYTMQDAMEASGVHWQSPIAKALSRKERYEKLIEEVEKLQRDFVQMDIRLGSLKVENENLRNTINDILSGNALLRKAVVHLYQEAGVECPANFGLPVMTQKILHPSETIQSKK